MSKQLQFHECKDILERFRVRLEHGIEQLPGKNGDERKRLAEAAVLSTVKNLLDRADDMAVLLCSFMDEMASFIEFLFQEEGVKVTGPSDWEFEYPLVGFKCESPSERTNKFFSLYDVEGKLYD